MHWRSCFSVLTAERRTLSRRTSNWLTKQLALPFVAIAAAEGSCFALTPLLEQPRPELRVAVGAVPCVVADARVLRVLDVRAGGAQGRIHLLRLRRQDDRVIRAVEDADGDVAQAFGRERIRVGGGSGEGRLLDGRRGAVGHDAAADRHQRGERIGVRQREMPRPESAEGEAGEIEPAVVAMELADCLLQRHHRRVGGPADPTLVRWRLRKDHDRGDPLGSGTDRRARADLHLAASVVSTLARAVQEQHDRPAPLRRPVARDVNGVRIGDAVERDRPIEESGLRMVHRAAGGEEENGCEVHLHGPVLLSLIHVMETLQVTARRIWFHNEVTGFTVATASREDSGEELRIVGTFPSPRIGEPLSVSGEWRNDPKYGRQFAADSVVPILPTSAEGVESYLAAGHVKGIGPTLAKRLVERFGADLLRVMDDEPERLREVPGVGRGRLRKIRESWDEQRGVRRVMVFLAEHGLGGARAFRIHQLYGDNAIAVIRQDPYRLAHEIRGIGFDTADALARRLGHDERSPFRLMAGLRHVVDAACEKGHCGIPAGDALTATVEVLGVEKELVAETIDAAVGNGVVIGEELDGRRVLWQPSLHRAESRIAARLAALADQRPRWSGIDPAEAVAVAEKESGIALDATQRRAIDLALKSKAVVITGGPGVGKTTLVRALLAVFQSAGLEVALAAPTGRAAKRLGESTGGFASTIHRLLETSPESGRFQRDEENPNEAHVLVVDEVSMVDVPLLDAVL